MTFLQRSELLYSMILLCLLLFVVVEGFPSLVVDEKGMQESDSVTVTHENSNDKSSADLLSDLLLDLREEIEMTITSASIAKIHKKETPKLLDRLQRCIATINRWTDCCNNREIIVSNN